MPGATTERPVTVENIKILQVGQYGVKVDEKTWFGVNKPLEPSNFEVGSGYKVSVTVSKTGKKYINEIVGKEDMKAAAPVTGASVGATQAVESDPVKAAEAALARAKADAEAKAKAAASAPKTAGHPSRAGFGQPLTDYDMAKDRQISRSGVVQAAVQSGAALQFATGLEEYLSNVKKIADFAFKYIQE